MKSISARKAMRILAVLLCTAMTAGLVPSVSIAEVTTKTLLDIGSNMSYTDKNSNYNHEISQGTNVIEHADYTNSSTCGVENSQYTVYQTKSSAYQQRLHIRQPASISLAGTIEAEARFKVKADSYGQNMPKLSLKWYWRDSGMYLETAENVVLTEESKDIWQTIKYVIDASSKTVTGYLNGNQVCSQTYKSELTDMGGDFGFMLVAQNAGESADGNALKVPVTWTFDSYKLTQAADI